MKALSSYYRKIIATIAQYLLRARDANLVQLPKKLAAGANCKNCHYWKETPDSEIGYCWKPEISVLVTEKQVCGRWAADGTISKWDKIKVNLLKDFRDRPPSIEGVELSQHGAIVYKDPKHAQRAVAVNMKVIPKEEKGSHCSNCIFSDGMDKWCSHPKVNQPIDKNDRCKYWNNPDAFTLREDK